MIKLGLEYLLCNQLKKRKNLFLLTDLNYDFKYRSKKPKVFFHASAVSLAA